MMARHAHRTKIERMLEAEPDICPMVYLAGFASMADFTTMAATFEMFGSHSRPLFRSDIVDISPRWHLADGTG